MRLTVLALAVVVALPAELVQAEQNDALGIKLMAAAAITLGAVAKVGGNLVVESVSSAHIDPYGIKAWMVNDCVYSLRAGRSIETRRYQADFRNLTGSYQFQGNSLIFFGTGDKPAICAFDGDKLSGCSTNLVVQPTYRPDAVINDVLFIQKNGCAPDKGSLPGGKDPF